MAIAASEKLIVEHYDFECAYLNGKLNDGEDIYMEFPEGFYNDKRLDGKALKLKKCIYGLRQSGRNWNQELDNAMLECGLIRCKVDRCVYIHRDGIMMTIVLVYVDDMAVMSNNAKFKADMIETLSRKFSLKTLGIMKYFLGMKVIHGDNYITIDQENMIDKILSTYNMSLCKCQGLGES